MRGSVGQGSEGYVVFDHKQAFSAMTASSLNPSKPSSPGQPARAPVDADTLDLAALSRRAAAWATDVSVFGGAFVAALEGLGLGRNLHLVVRGVVSKRYDDALLGLTPLLVLALGFAVVWIAYRVTGTALWGSSLGKLAFGVRVVDAWDGASPPGWGKAWARWAVPQVLGLVPLPGSGGIAYLWAVREPHRRGLHDKAAGTVVVRARPAAMARSRGQQL